MVSTLKNHINVGTLEILKSRDSMRKVMKKPVMEQFEPINKMTSK